MLAPNDVTILVVDDEAGLRKALVFDFKRRGFNVMDAACGNDALEILRKYKIHVVLSDVKMPNGDGIELLDKIKDGDSEIPVVMFITGFADLTLEDAYDKGADAIFSKPFDRKEVIETVIKAIKAKDEIWRARPHERIETDFKIKLSFPELVVAIQGRALNIGRGGMFVALQERFPMVSSNASFNIQFRKGSPQVIEGSGIVRWVRTLQSQQDPIGCGVEFEHLGDTSRKQIIDFINSIRPKAFIPKR